MVPGFVTGKSVVMKSQRVFLGAIEVVKVICKKCRHAVERTTLPKYLIAIKFRTFIDCST